jgi:site-specific DNA-methyltransferase (adenine-specific)
LLGSFESKKDNVVEQMTQIILNGDCLELMRGMLDKSVDLFICDLPYGCLTGGGGQEKSRRRFQNGKDTGGLIKQNEGVIAGCSWDIKLDLNAFWTQVKRLCKDDHTPVLMFCNTKFGFDLYNSNPDWFRYDLVWNKMRGVSFLSANKMPMKSHEMVYVFSKKGANYYRKDIEGDFKKWKNNETKRYGVVYGDLSTMVRTTHGEGSEGKRCAVSVIEIKGKAIKGQHPTEKPVELYKWLIERYSKKGDRVLDPTFGSGNSGRACKELERSYTGIEMDNAFFWKYVSSKMDSKFV